MASGSQKGLKSGEEALDILSDRFDRGRKEKNNRALKCGTGSTRSIFPSPCPARRCRQSRSPEAKPGLALPPRSTPKLGRAKSAAFSRNPRLSPAFMGRAIQEEDSHGS
jgi:hypothetical protein